MAIPATTQAIHPAGCHGGPTLFLTAAVTSQLLFSYLFFFVISQLRGESRVAQDGLCGRMGLLDFAEARASANEVGQKIKSPWCCPDLQHRACATNEA